MKALIQNNKVMQVVSNEDIFPVHETLSWIDCPEDCCPGLSYDEANDSFISSESLLTLDELKAMKQQEINDGFTSLTSTMLGSSVTEAEQKTFSIQEQEALAYQADATASVPRITALAAQRGITISELVTRILAKVDAYSAIFFLMGQKHAMEDQLDAATTEADLSNINVTYNI